MHTYLGPGGQRRDVVEHGAALREGHPVLQLLDEGHLISCFVLSCVLRGNGEGWGRWDGGCVRPSSNRTPTQLVHILCVCRLISLPRTCVR